MSTKSEVIAAIDAAMDVANNLDDQSAVIAQLQADNAALRAKIDAAIAQAQADKDADAANVAGQGVLDALA